MHELGVVFQAIKIVEEVAKENNLTEIESVTVEIGEVSTVIESYLQNCWKWSVEKKSDIMHNCKLHVEKSLQLPIVRTVETNMRLSHMAKLVLNVTALILIFYRATSLT